MDRCGMVRFGHAYALGKHSLASQGTHRKDRPYRQPITVPSITIPLSLRAASPLLSPNFFR
ncbi:MAG: hypothetical protein RIS70_1753 [Planctomycetota bacterium]|jgi:hypothetical protein